MDIEFEKLDVGAKGLAVGWPYQAVVHTRQKFARPEEQTGGVMEFARKTQPKKAAPKNDDSSLAAMVYSKLNEGWADKMLPLPDE